MSLDVHAVLEAWRTQVAPSFDWAQVPCTCGLGHRNGQPFSFEDHWSRHCPKASALQEATDRAIKLAYREGVRRV